MVARTQKMVFPFILFLRYFKSPLFKGFCEVLGMVPLLVDGALHLSQGGITCGFRDVQDTKGDQGIHEGDTHAVDLGDIVGFITGQGWFFGHWGSSGSISSAKSSLVLSLL